jgi:putative heme-binding domain-containing protein
VSFNYAGESIRLRDGTELVGIVGSETAGEIALRLPGGITTRHAKAEIASRAPLDVSLMPDGLERSLTEQELVDLVEYMTTLR